MTTSAQPQNYIETAQDPDAWFADRVWCTSANRVADMSNNKNDDEKKNDREETTNEPRVTTQATSIYFPKSTKEVASLIQSHPETPVAVVCGGHEVSNAALVAEKDAMVLDMKNMKDISVEGKEVTVAGGVLLEELARTVHNHGGALPVGTGSTVGVVGYLVNGGISGYFSRRLGLLGQRVTRMTVVDAAGDVLHLTPEDGPAFYSRLGAGSALGVVTEVTLLMEDASIMREAKQFCFISDDRETILQFSRWALKFMRDVILPNESVSMECITSSSMVLLTLVFYDTFEGPVSGLTDLVYTEAERLPKLTLMQEKSWNTWIEVAGGLWPILKQVTGSPLASLNHCIGTKSSPSDAQLEFVADTFIGQAPLLAAEMSIVEARTLGGEIFKRPKLPSGNCHNEFFVDLIVAYDAGNKTNEENREITDQTTLLMQEARKEPGLSVDFSGTHCQADSTRLPVVAAEIFGDAESAKQVKDMKKATDPSNRFCFHPFAEIL